MAKVMVGHGVDFLAVSFVRAAADLRKVRRRRADDRAPGRQDRDARRGGGAGRDRRRGRRDHGGSRRPGHRVPDGGRAAPAEADHPPLRRDGRPGDHGHADDGEHDHRRVADARRGQRRGERRVRRHRRADAQRGDRAVGADPVAVVRAMVTVAAAGRRWRPATRSGASGSAGRSATAGPTVRTGSRWRSPTLPGSPRWTAVPRPSCAAPARAVPPRQWPGSARRPSCSGSSPDPATVRAMALSWGVIPLQVDTYVSTDELVWFAVETAVRGGHVRIAGHVAPGSAGFSRQTASSGAAHRRVEDRQRRVSERRAGR